MNNSPLVLDDQKIPSVSESISAVPPVGYIPITLQTQGVLSMPAKFHMRDYTMEDVLQLNIMDEEQFLPNIVNIFNKLIWEKNIDCADMHSNEFTETLYTLYGSFIGSTVEKDYYINEDLPEGEEEGQLDHPSNIATVDLPIGNIPVQNIHFDKDGVERIKKFKEPFGIADTLTGDSFKFRLSRLKDIIFAQNYCDKEFAIEKQKFAQFKFQLDQIRNKYSKDKVKLTEEITNFVKKDLATYSAYIEFTKRFDAEILRLVQIQCIVSCNGVPINSIEEKLDLYKNRIHSAVWATYNDAVAMFPFGLQDEVTFYSDALKKDITRRFQFQLTDFLPDSSKSDSRRATVSFD